MRRERVIHAFDVALISAIDQAPNDHPNLFTVAIWDHGHAVDGPLGVVQCPSDHAGLLVAVNGAAQKLTVRAHTPQDLLGLLRIDQPGDAAAGDVLGQCRNVGAVVGVEVIAIPEGAHLAPGSLYEKRFTIELRRPHLGRAVATFRLGSYIGRGDGLFDAAAN